MKIGIFDSGLGGLLILKEIRKVLPEYNYVYLGDTLRLPYGNRSQQQIYEFTKNGIEFLFKKNCSLIIIACNTASSKALRRIQKSVLPNEYPNRKVLGVIIPSVESALEKPVKNVAVLATSSTIESKVFEKEIKKINTKVKIYAKAAPLLASAIELNEADLLPDILEFYLKSVRKNRIESLILGCTHYSLVKKLIGKNLGKGIKVVSQDEIIPQKLKLYLQNHPEIEHNLDTKQKLELYATEQSEFASRLAKKWFGQKTKLLLVKY